MYLCQNGQEQKLILTKTFKCDENTPCGRCVQVALSRKIFKQPCYRVSLDEVHIFRAGDSDHGQTRCRLPIMQWCPDRQTKIVQLRWPFKHDVANPPILEVECQKFMPRPKDILKEEFVLNGEVKAVTLPPYACVCRTRNSSAWFGSLTCSPERHGSYDEVDG